MNNHARLTRTALAVIVVALTLYSCTSVAPTAPATMSSQTPTSTPTSAPTATPSSTPVPSVTPAPSGPALTETFTSATYGISISYPAGWSVQRASEPWTGGPFFFREPVADFLYDPSLTDHLFLALASQPLSGQSPSSWAADLLAAEGCDATEPVLVDGAEGLIGPDCDVVLTGIDDRGYIIWLYVSGDDPAVREVHSRAWFEQVLATVQLNPQDALARYAAGFSMPFSYVLPAGPEFDYGSTNQTWFEIRVPAFAEAGHPGGVILQAIGEAHLDPCDSRSDTLPIRAGPQAVIDHLKTVPQIEVSDEGPATVGDIPAVQATIVATPTTACPAVRPFTEDTEPIPGDIPLRVVAFDVGEEHLVFAVFGEADNPGFAEMAESYIDSVRFE